MTNSFKGVREMKRIEAAGNTGRGPYALATSLAQGWFNFGVFTDWGLAAPRRVSHPL